MENNPIKNEFEELLEVEFGKDWRGKSTIKYYRRLSVILLVFISLMLLGSFTEYGTMIQIGVKILLYIVAVVSLVIAIIKSKPAWL